MGCVSWSEVAEYGCEWRSLSVMIMNFFGGIGRRQPFRRTTIPLMIPPPQVIVAAGNVLGQVDEFEHSLFNEDATFIHVCLFRGSCM